MEQTPAKGGGKELYLPHLAVIRENAETTIFVIFFTYDASAHAWNITPSLSKYLHVGPLLNARALSSYDNSRRFTLCFLQIIVCESKQNALRFHKIKIQIHKK